MKYVAWMMFVGVAVVLFADIPYTKTYYYTIDYFELSHVYADGGQLLFDQMILWEWADYHYIDENGVSKKQKVPKVIDWYAVGKYRKKLTIEEQRKKDKELAQEWVKQFGIGADRIVPPYTPPFERGVAIPRYDHRLKLWKVLLVKETGIIIIYATSFVESWTQHDPEVDNNRLFGAETRKNYLRRIK